MGWIARLRSLVAGIFGRRNLEDRMSDEFRFHVEQFVDDEVRKGTSRDEAERRARVEFGGVGPLKDECREARGLGWIDEIRQDLGYGLRSFRRNKGFSLTSIVTLALGIGATTAVFSVIHAVLLRPLPYPERLVRIEVTASDRFGGSTRTGSLIMNDFPAVRDRAGSLVDVSAYGPAAATLTGEGPPVRLAGAQASPSLFRLLGAVPVMGRLFDIMSIRRRWSVLQSVPDPD
jgi:hypothetical protein